MIGQQSDSSSYVVRAAMLYDLSSYHSRNHNGGSALQVDKCNEGLAIQVKTAISIFYMTKLDNITIFNFFLN